MKISSYQIYNNCLSYFESYKLDLDHYLNFVDTDSVLHDFENERILFSILVKQLLLVVID